MSNKLKKPKKTIDLSKMSRTELEHGYMELYTRCAIAEAKADRFLEEYRLSQERRFGKSSEKGIAGQMTIAEYMKGEMEPSEDNTGAVEEESKADDEAEIKELKDFLKAYKIKCSDTMYQKLASTRREVVSPLTLDDGAYAAAWLKVEYRHKKIPEDAPQLYTENNEQVRSKSEVIIANALKAAGVPYRYEFPLLVDRNPEADAGADFCQLHPDFYCLNLRTRQEFAWEHFGMMDDPEYAARATEKLELYAENGFFPGKNFIITMETSAKPLSSKLLKSVIKTYLK